MALAEANPRGGGSPLVGSHNVYKAKPYNNEKSDYSQWMDEYLEEEGEYLKEHGIKLDGW